MMHFLRSMLHQGDIGLAPVTGMSKTDDTRHFSVTSTHPLGRLDLNHCLRGWFMLEAVFQLPSRLDRATFFFRDKDGWDLLPPIEIGLQSRRISKRIVFLPFAPCRILIEPCTHTGDLTVERLRLKPLTRVFAKSRMLGKLGRMHPLFRKKSPKKILELIAGKKTAQSKTLIEALYSDYDDLFDESKGIPDPSYPLWLEIIERPGLPSPDVIERFLSEHTRPPCFSIILPVYNTPKTYLRACLESVLAQSYPNWELCVADDASTKAHVQAVLASYAERDSRIRIVTRSVNGHISAASNSALDVATGDFAAFMDHDDILSEHALFHMAQAIMANPNARLFYSDEDKIDENGERFDPHFKSDWNPDLLFAHNYITHLCVIDRRLVAKTGGLRTGLEGSQDYDLVLRCQAQLKPDQIIHVPRILYHWRAVAGSTAFSSEEKNYSERAGYRALTDFMNVHQSHPEVENGPVPNSYRVRWPIPDPAPQVTLIIPTRDKKDLLEQCLSSILTRTTYPNFEILILDNDSREQATLDYFATLHGHPRVCIEAYPHPFNYSAMNNFGVQRANGKIIGLVNNDIEVITPEWLEEMVAHAVRPDIACVGAKLLYPDDTIQHAGVICSLGGVAGHSHKFFPRFHPGYFNRLRLPHNLSAVTGACLLVRKSLFVELGGLDETNLSVAFNDVDFCLRACEAGFRNLWTPNAELYHHESASRDSDDTPEKARRFQKEVEYMQHRWGIALERDPYYNPNLTRSREDFKMEMSAHIHPLLQESQDMYLQPFQFAPYSQQDT